MRRAHHERMVERLRAGEHMSGAPFEIEPERYRSETQLARERGAFDRPRVATLSSALAPGSVLPIDEPGRSVVLARDREGVLRAFTNACRHRATRLVDAPCDA